MQALSGRPKAAGVGRAPSPPWPKVTALLQEISWGGAGRTWESWPCFLGQTPTGTTLQTSDVGEAAQCLPAHAHIHGDCSSGLTF